MSNRCCGRGTSNWNGNRKEARTIKLKYWFVHNDSIGNIFEDEKGNWIVVFDGIVKIGEPFRVKEIHGDEVDANEIGAA